VLVETGESRRESQLVRVMVCVVTEDAMARCGDENIGRFQSQESMEKVEADIRPQTKHPTGDIAV
jgi:hypothetical protein